MKLSEDGLIALGEVVEEVGTVKRLAELCGVTRQTIHNAMSRRTMSAELARDIAAASKKEGIRERLRPDLWA